MLPFGYLKKYMASLALVEGLNIRNKPRAGNICTVLDDSNHFYAVADSGDHHESIRLGLLFQEEGDMRLVDEGYITLTYNDPIPESYSFVETSAGFVDSYKVDGNKITLEMNDSKTGHFQGPLFILFDYEYNNGRSHQHFGKSTRNAQVLAEAEYCTGVSPTESTPNVQAVSPVEFCEEIELHMRNAFACRSCSSVQASASLGGIYSAGDYLEVEFSGFVDFKSLPDPIKEVRHMTGNVWQILFSDWYDFSTNQLNFELELAFIGSPGMAPKVNWSRMCQQEALAEIDESLFVSDIPENCIVLQDDRWDHSFSNDDRDVQLQLILEDDRESDFFLKDFSYVNVKYFPAPEASSVAAISTETDDGSVLLTSTLLNGDTVSLEIDDSLTGEEIVMVNFGFEFPEGDGPSFKPIPQEVQLCQGPSPTEFVGIFDPTEGDDCINVIENVSIGNSWTCRACMSIVGDEQFLFEETLNAGGFVEIEFEGEVDFIGLSDTFSDAINTQGNVWKLFFSNSMESLDFTEQLKFTGSEGMTPRLNWAQVCRPPITTTIETTTVVTEPDFSEPEVTEPITTPSPLCGPATNSGWCSAISVEATFSEHELCNNCATLQITNLEALAQVAPGDFMEMEISNKITFKDIAWPFIMTTGPVSPLCPSLIRVYLAEDFNGFGMPSELADMPVTVGEIEFKTQAIPDVLFMNFCSLEHEGNGEEPPETTPAPETTPSTTITTTSATPTFTSTISSTTISTTTATENACAREMNWNGAKYMKIMEKTQNSAQIRINMINRKEIQKYSGFIIFSKKNCGIDFLNGMQDGRLGWEIMDKKDYYDNSGLYSFLRMDGAQTSLTIQFQNGVPDKSSSNLGDSSKDQFYLGLTGLQNIDFGSKDCANCLTKGKVGWTKFEDGDYTECAGKSTNVGFKWEPEEN